MIDRKKLAREIAARTEPRFIEIEPTKPTRRFTAHENHVKKFGPIVPRNVPDGPPLNATRLMSLGDEPRNVLEDEQQRLIDLWIADGFDVYGAK